MSDVDMKESATRIESGISDEPPRKRVKVEEPVETTSQVDRQKESTLRLQAAQDQIAQESKFGILAFVSDSSGFSCILKQRYTDFLVNEIRPNGRVVHLTETSAPQPQSNPQNKEPLPPANIAKVEPESAGTNGQTTAEKDTTEATDDTVSFQLSDEDRATLTAIFGSVATDALVSVYAKVLARPGKKARDLPQHITEPIEDKQKRTDAHVAVRRIFTGKIETLTLDDNRIHIKAGSSSTRKPRGDGGPRTKGKVGWDELGGEYLHFSLYKENKDTMEVLYFIASQLKIHVKHFQFAGTKDRRGVTVQRVSIHRVVKERLQGLNPRLRQARLCDFEYKTEPLELGSLLGNEFTIALRECQSLYSKDATSTPLEESIGMAVEALATSGFINYYGLQRFGSFAVSTDEIGKLMLKGDLQGAVEGILQYSPALLSEADNAETKTAQDDIARARAIDAWHKTRKTGNAVDLLPRRFQAENAIIRHLGQVDRSSGQQRTLTDWRGALAQIPRNLRLMYVHAYQSRIWNAVAASRHAIYGLSVVEGDLVLIQQDTSAAVNDQEEVDEQGEPIIRPAGDDSARALEDKFERARALSKEEAESGKYSIFDIVLPQPGFDVEYPANKIGEYYSELMAEDGLDPRDMRRSWKDVSLSGSYRKVMALPHKVSHEIRKYQEDDEQLALTDADRLDGKAELPCAGEGDKVAVIIKLQLGSSQYATMALRELTRGGALAFKPEYSAR